MSTTPITNIINAVTSHLEKHFTDCSVESFPDNLDDYSFTHGNAAILVRFAGSEQDQLTDASQQERVQVTITHLTRTLHGKHGGYTLIDEIRDQMSGRAFAGATPCFRAASAFRGQKKGISRFDSVFEMKVWLQDVFEDEAAEYGNLIHTNLEKDQET